MISFCKMQATGNDFIIIDCLNQTFRFSYSNLTKFLCDRRYGVGADGVIFIEKSNIAEYKMRIFNQDGTEAGMCGNGIRCLAKYLYEENLVDVKNFKIETLSGIKEIEIIVENRTVVYVKVSMGNPVFEFNKIPVIFPNVIEKELESLKINIEDKEYIGFPMSMGNPHCVIFEEDLKNLKLEEIGSIIENYKYFPNKTNVEFVKVMNRNKIKVMVWERGVGRTLGCGTGACSATVVSILKNYINNEVVVELEGGIVKVKYDVDTNSVILMGNAEKVFKGEIDI